MVRVVDASYVLSFLIPDEFTDKGAYKKLFSGEFGLVAPELLKFEVANALLLASRRRRMSVRKSAKLVELFVDSPIEYKQVDLSRVFSLAGELGLTVYDASYVWLARKLGVKLLTRDKKMLAAISD